MLYKVHWLLMFSIPLLLAGCGGGGSSGSAPAPTPPPPPVGTDFDQGIFAASSIYKDICLNPRAGNFPDVQGTTDDENDWLRAWSNDLYLWYDEILDEDPRLFTTPDYFDVMKTFATTSTGNARDNFHFTFDTEEWLLLSQSGISAGYGADFELISTTPPREAIVAFVEPGSPADSPGSILPRGTRILEVDGEDLVNGTSQAAVDALNAGLFPSAAGETHEFVVENFDGTNRRTVTIVSANVVQNPVPETFIIDTASGAVGYMLFNSHIAPAEADLVFAMDDLEAEGVTELILDMRYNGGGFLDIANMLAYMIAGPSAAAGRIFDETQFNNKHVSVNPVTGQALSPDFFHEVTQGFSSIPAGDPLPSLNLSRVFILSGPGTCSASEAVINGLRGIGVEVVLIGDTTCGKPYGFYATDNCGTTYFSIQFRGVNANGFGDYSDGFVPTDTPVEAFEVTGCPVADDFSRQLGDLDEWRLATALNYMDNPDCSTAVPANFTPNAVSAAKIVRLSNSAGAIGKPNKMPGSIKR